MSLEKLLAKIEEDARSEGEGLLRKAEAEAAGIKSAGAEEARRSAESIRASFRARGERERTRIMSEALTEGRAAYLSTQDELFEEVFVEAAREFASMPEGRYRAWLKRVILENAAEGLREVIAAPHDRGLLAAGLLEEINADLRGREHAEELVLSDRKADFDRGVILRGEKFALNLSLQSLAREVRERHEEEVMSILFGGMGERGRSA